MLRRRKIRIRKTTSLRCGVRRLIGRITNRRKVMRRRRSFSLSANKSEFHQNRLLGDNRFIDILSLLFISSLEKRRQQEPLTAQSAHPHPRPEHLIAALYPVWNQQPHPQSPDRF